MKPCPHCNAELRDSVIKCTHCGRSLRDAPEPVAATSTVTAPSRHAPPPARIEPGDPRPTPAGARGPWAPPREEKLGWWTPNPRQGEPERERLETETTASERELSAPTTLEREASRPTTEGDVETQVRPAWTGKPDAWATPTRVLEPAPAAPADPPRAAAPPSAAPSRVPPQAAGPTQELRALEKRSGAHPDFLLLLAGAAAAAVAAIAWQAVAEPWVHLQITDTTEGTDPVSVGDMVIRGRGALIGTIGQVVAGVVGALGVMWFLFGFDKGWTMRWFATPTAAILASLAGLAAAGLASSLWFVWENAAVQRARAVGMTPEKLRELLDQQPAPSVEIAHQPGLVRFALMMGLAFVAACVAMSAANKRA